MNKELITVRINGEYVDVEAWCVAGVEGIFAIFLYNDMTYLAAGDDGFWWSIMSYAPSWHYRIHQAFSESSSEMDKLAKKLKKRR